MTFERLSDFIGNNLLLSLAFIGVTIALIVGELARLSRKYRSVGPAGLTELVNRDNALVIDLRPGAEFEKGHIAGSRNLSMGQFDPENKLLTKARELPVVLVCQRGATSGPVAGRLAKAGFSRAHVLEGGIAAWQAADLPLVRGRESK